MTMTKRIVVSLVALQLAACSVEPEPAWHHIQSQCYSLDNIILLPENSVLVDESGFARLETNIFAMNPMPDVISYHHFNVTGEARWDEKLDDFVIDGYTAKQQFKVRWEVLKEIWGIGPLKMEQGELATYIGELLCRPKLPKD